MTRFARIRRRPDHWSSEHARARARAAERLDGPLGLAEATWLDGHLAACVDCARVAAAYDADRLLLRSLRDEDPEPPRDLWARTAAAIEQESAARGRTPVPAGRTSGRRVPLGVLSGVAVIAVVVGVSAVSSGFLGGTDGSVALQGNGSPAPEVGGASTDVTGGGAVPESAEALPTPLAVGAGSVKWLRTEPDGAFAFNAAPVHEVCPVGGDAECATLGDGSGSVLDLAANPKTIIGSPSQDQAVVVSDDGHGGERITVVDLPIDRVGEVPAETPTAAPSQAPTETPAASAAPTGEPTLAPSTDPTETTATASAAPVESTSPAPTEEPATPAPTVTVSPEPTVAASLAIASDIEVVGESAAFSGDGTWFAFTAQPIGGSGGPDVYVWRVGDEAARRLTSDGVSQFASWRGNEVVASRAGTVGAGSRANPQSVFIDPATGDERPAGAAWRPVFDPRGQRAVAWIGTVTADAAGTPAVPAAGRLELRSWVGDAGMRDTDGQVVHEASGADFDVRWDGTGEWFAVWIADPSGAEIGRLSLFRVEPVSDRLVSPDGAPADVPALAGFSIGEGRLAWVTPPGQDGEGSRVQVVAWTPDGVGSVETAPGEDVIVVR